MNCTLILLLIQLVPFQNHTLPLTNNCNNRKPSSNFLDHIFFQAFIFRLWRWTELIVLKKMSRAFNAFSLGVWSTRFRAVFTASVFWCLSFLVYNMYHLRTGIDSVRESGSQSFKGRTLWLAVTFLVCLWQGPVWPLASSCLVAQDDLELLNPPACTFLRPGLPASAVQLAFCSAWGNHSQGFWHARQTLSQLS